MAERQDRLYSLLPAIYQETDAAKGYPLRELLRVLSDPLNRIEDDIGHLYDNWFIETCDEWVVPYIAELIGFTPTGGTITRAEVANALRNRSRKGSVKLLEKIASDLGFPARAVEEYRRLSRMQHIKYLYTDRHRTADVRNAVGLDRLGGAFEHTARTVDVRRPNSNRTSGRFSPGAVAVFAYPVPAFPVTERAALGLESPYRFCFTFSILGNNAPLYFKGNPPEPIRRVAFWAAPDRFYGVGKSFAIYRGVPAAQAPAQSTALTWTPVPLADIVPADLSRWDAYLAPRGKILVDPELGRLALPETEVPHGVRVSFFYGFSAPMGGGEYVRKLSQADGSKVYKVRRVKPAESGVYPRIGDAIGAWRADQQTPGAKLPHAVIEIEDSSVYSERISIDLGVDETLQIRAGNRHAPVIRLLDRTEDEPDSLRVQGAKGSRLTLDGLLLTGRAVSLCGELSAVTIRHCTLVPGWSLKQNRDRPYSPAYGFEAQRPALEFYETNAAVSIDSSIVGSIQIQHDARHREPIRFEIRDSIIDGTTMGTPAIRGAGQPVAPIELTIRRSTVFGTVHVHSIALAEDTIFAGLLQVSRRNRGCVRFCWVPPASRTPRKYECQPDLAIASEGKVSEVDTIASVTPRFASTYYGTVDYARLSTGCNDAIRLGASDRGEMGAFHNLFEPRRIAALEQQLEEYSAADMEAGLIVVEPRNTEDEEE